MIFQTFHDPATREQLFRRGPYVPFDLLSLGLEPTVQTQLCEYAAIRHLYHNPGLNDHDWIGFTSVNQRRPYCFGSAAAVAAELALAPIVVWGWHEMIDGDTGMPLPLAATSEICHPGINPILRRLMRKGDFAELPPLYFQSNAGPFCNYWAMRQELFQTYMAWSLPLVEFCLTRLDEPFFQKFPRGLSYIHERLFILWLAQTHTPVCRVGPTIAVRVNVPRGKS